MRPSQLVSMLLKIEGQKRGVVTLLAYFHLIFTSVVYFYGPELELLTVHQPFILD